MPRCPKFVGQLRRPLGRYADMITLGVLLALVGALMKIGILLMLGVVLIVVGLFMNFMPVADGSSRRRWY
jgi:hypothetical protein